MIGTTGRFESPLLSVLLPMVVRQANLLLDKPILFSQIRQYFQNMTVGLDIIAKVVNR